MSIAFVIFVHVIFTLMSSIYICLEAASSCFSDRIFIRNTAWKSKECCFVRVADLYLL